MISVIIPALNEEHRITRCIESVTGEDTSCEVIVCDGGSTDSTVNAALGCEGVRVLRTGRGRGVQMNGGAALAGGDTLLFLHADTLLERGWSAELLCALQSNSSVVGGAFSFAIDGADWRYRLVERWVKYRCRLIALPYGDQAIFVRREVFERIGGYAGVPLMEDVDLIGRLKKEGGIAVLEKRAFTHERRWKKNGVFRNSLKNQMIMALYRLGAEPQDLARIYYR